MSNFNKPNPFSLVLAMDYYTQSIIIMSSNQTSIHLRCNIMQHDLKSTFKDIYLVITSTLTKITSHNIGYNSPSTTGFPFYNHTKDCKECQYLFGK